MRSVIPQSFILLSVAFVLAVTASLCRGQVVSLAWSPSASPAVAGYALHYGGVSGVYDSRFDAGSNCAAVLTGLTPGQTYYFVVTAYDSLGYESAPSNEASFTVIPGNTPGNPLVLRPLAGNGGSVVLAWTALVGQMYQVQYKTNLNQTTWLNMGSSITATNTFETASNGLPSGPQRFYRVLVVQ